MNCYTLVRTHLFVDPHSQHGETAWLLGVLNLGEQLDVETTGNPFSEVVSDLESRGFSPNALARVRQMLNIHATKYDQGQR